MPVPARIPVPGPTESPLHGVYDSLLRSGDGLIEGALQQLFCRVPSRGDKLDTKDTQQRQAELR